MQAFAFCPAHVTGIVQFCDEHSEILKMGSKGAGISITRGISTKVREETSYVDHSTIQINGKATNYAPVSEYVLRKYQSMVSRKYTFAIEHYARIPIGAGFGASGAGALSLSLALNDLLDMGLSRIEAAQIAHEAEVKCKTGLGTVVAETSGGLEVRTKEGGPGVCEIKHIEPDGHRTFVSLCFGPMSTVIALSNPQLRRQINNVGPLMVDKLIHNSTVENFLRYSRIFTEEVGLMTNKVARIIQGLHNSGYDCGMAMFGEVVFTLTRPEEAEEVMNLFRRFSYEGTILTAGIDNEGARTLC
jgi:pantoate kinase